jgi:hypothetical protein
MPKRFMQGTGLRARLVVQFDPGTEGREITEAFRNFVGPDGERAKFAAIAVAQDRDNIAPEVAKEIDLWLLTYERLNAARSEVLAGDYGAMERLVMLAEDLGKVKERMWWRFGVVHGLDRSAEDLGLTGMPVVLGQKSAAAKTNATHKQLREKRFARMKTLTATLGVEKAARHCEAEGLGGWQAIRRQWDRFKGKNPDT